MAVINMLGQKFGKLTVRERDMTRTGGAAYWICDCECGGVKITRGQNLRDGSVVDCGCGKKERSKTRLDLISQVGKQYGRLTVLERDLSKESGRGKSSYWLCQCECGEIVSVSMACLSSGSTKSCGCLKRDGNKARNTLDLTDKRFGYLVAMERLEEQKHGSYIWKCQCDCGNIAYVDASTLNLGMTTSCGCKHKRSLGETKIQQLLTQAHLKFDTEYTFSDCVNPITGYRYRFDFAILSDDNKVVRLIEFDGEQHYKDKSDWSSRDSLEYIQYKDNQKNQYAKTHNLPLVRIPYIKLKTLTLDDLIGEEYLIR